MRLTPRGIVFLFAVVWTSATAFGGCASRPPTDPVADTGTVQMALTATTNGHSYRLRQATFTITGPSSVVLNSEAQPDAPALTAQLDVGSYTVLLSGPWFLERLDPAGPVEVTATLTSANPASFAITAGATTGVPFRFATDGTIVTIGTGSVSITTEVTETSGELSLLAGKLGGFGSGDGVGPDGRFFRPTGVASDGAGNLYVADFFNGLIRRVEIGTGAVTTIAGTLRAFTTVDGVGTNASFFSPQVLVYDGSGSLYLMDGTTLRKVVLATAAVTTVAGATGRRFRRWDRARRAIQPRRRLGARRRREPVRRRHAGAYHPQGRHLDVRRVDRDRQPDPLRRPPRSVARAVEFAGVPGGVTESRARHRGRGRSVARHFLTRDPTRGGGVGGGGSAPPR